MMGNESSIISTDHKSQDHPVCNLHSVFTLTIGGFSGKIHPGGMAEWSKAAVLKIVECNSSVGSNPTPTAI